MEPGFRDLVIGRLDELTTMQLVGEWHLVQALRLHAEELTALLLNPTSYDAWILKQDHLLRRSSLTLLAWTHVGHYAESFSDHVRELQELRRAMQTHGGEDNVTWDLRGASDVMAHLIATLGCHIYERLTPGIRSSGDLPKLAAATKEEIETLRSYHELRDSYEHWDERADPKPLPKNAEKDLLVRVETPDARSIGRSSDNDGRAILRYPSGSILVVDLTLEGAARVRSIVGVTEARVRSACQAEVLRFLEDFPEARWVAQILGSTIRNGPFRSARE